MKPPAIRTQFLGHPLVGGPLILVGLGLLYTCWHIGQGAVIVAPVALILLLSVTRASEQMTAYRAWKREWDAMGEAPTRPKHAAAIIWLSVAVGFVAVAFLGSQPDLLSVEHLLGWPLGIAAVLLGALLLRGLIRRLGRRRVRLDRAMPVKVVATALRPPLPLAAAYAALPAYCRQLMSGGDTARQPRV